MNKITKTYKKHTQKMNNVQQKTTKTPIQFNLKKIGYREYLEKTHTPQNKHKKFLYTKGICKKWRYSRYPNHDI